MNDPLPPSNGAPTGDDLVAFLRERGVEAELVAPGVPMPTVPLAAAAIGVTEDQIIKSLLFRDSRGELVLAITSGTARIDRGLLAFATGLERPRMADAATVLAATGYPAGGVAPVGHARPIRVVIDRRAAQMDVVYGGGGTEDVLLRIRPRDIIRLTSAEIADIALAE